MGSCGILLKIQHARVSEQPPLTTCYVYYNYCENNYLYAIYGKIVITGAVYISQLLNVTHTLQVLNMNFNDIGDDGMAVISEALQHNKSLTTLMVRGCELSVKGTVVCKM